MIRLLLALICLAAPAAAQTRTEVFDQTFYAVQAAIGHPAATALARASARAAARDPALAALLRARDGHLADLRHARDRQAALILRPDAEARAEQAAIGAALATTTAAIAGIDARLDRDFPAFRALGHPAPLKRSEVQALLGPDEALVFLAGDDRATYAWAISPRSADWIRAEALPAAALAEAVQALRRDLGADLGRTPAPGGRVLPFDRHRAWRLYDQLLRPLEPVTADATHLIVVTDGPLGSLPLSLLPTARPEGADDDPAALRATPWLIRRQALSTLPAVAALATLRGAMPPRPGPREAFAGFGDPRLGYLAAGAEADAAAFSRGTYEDLARVADLAPLPGTRVELTALAAELGAGPDRLFLGEAATEARVKAMDLSRTDIIAFATHGLLADGLPGLDEPALVLTPPDRPTAEDDALLTASEAAALDLSASLIILSACDTAGSDGTPGAEGLSGLARAFIYAGARALLVSHWPVDDRAAARLTTGMVRRMTAGTDRSEALRQSMLALIDDPVDPTLAHPRLWAPFVLVGEGGL